MHQRKRTESSNRFLSSATLHTFRLWPPKHCRTATTEELLKPFTWTHERRHAAALYLLNISAESLIHRVFCRFSLPMSLPSEASSNQHPPMTLYSSAGLSSLGRSA